MEYSVLSPPLAATKILKYHVRYCSSRFIARSICCAISGGFDGRNGEVAAQKIPGSYTDRAESTVAINVARIHTVQLWLGNYAVSCIDSTTIRAHPRENHISICRISSECEDWEVGYTTSNTNTKSTYTCSNRSEPSYRASKCTKLNAGQVSRRTRQNRP